MINITNYYSGAKSFEERITMVITHPKYSAVSFSKDVVSQRWLLSGQGQG